jgi:iron complex outermembrane recepter protein
MKKFFFFLLFINAVFVIRSFAQNSADSKKEYSRGNPKATLSGNVTSLKTGKPLESATIMIPDLKLGVVTDTSGHYNFKILASGSYLVEVILTGYKTISQTIMLDGDTKADFKLEESYTENAEVVVTGISKATQIKENPVPIVSISHDYLTHELSTNAIDAIAKIPGVTAVTTGPNVSKPFIRGLGYNRILTLYDGVRQEGQQWGDEHGIEVDEYGVDHVEVIKGPASLTYGSDALAGVVNIIPTQAPPEGKLVGDYTNEYQTNDKYLGGSVMLGGTKNGFEWMGRFSHKQAVDYENAVDGRVFGTAFNETDGSATFGIHRSWGFSHLNLVLFNDLQEIPDGSRDSATWQFTKQISELDDFRPIVPQSELNSYAIEPLHQHVQHYRAFLTNHFILGRGSLDVNLGFQSSIRQEFSHPLLPDVPGLYLQLHSYTYDIKYSLPSVNNWNITTGINGMYQQNTSTNGTDFIIPNYNQFDVGAFAVAKKTYGKLDIAGGARYDVRVFNNDQLYTRPSPNIQDTFDVPVYGADTIGANKVFSNYSKTFSGVSGSLGATYNFSEKFSVKANISRGYRAPNIAEISANGVHPGTNIYQIGNPDFNPEFSLQEDIGGEFSSKYAEITLSVFHNTISNYIYNQKLNSVHGGDSIIVAGNETFKFQQGKADLYGGELSIDIHPVKKLHFENTLAIVYGNNVAVAGKPITDSTKYLPFIPPVHGISDVRYDFNIKHTHITHAFVKAEMDYFASQNRIFSAYGTETPTPGYTLFGLGAGAGFTNKKGNTMFSVYVLANNIFNIVYWDNLSRLKYFYGDYLNPAANDNPQEHGIYNMGRNISIKLDVPIDGKM